MMPKNMRVGEAYWKIWCRFFLDAVSAIKSLFAGEATYFIAIIKAHFAFLYWLFFVKRKRSFLYAFQASSNRYLRGSVVWAHFVGGKKRFDEIVKEN